MSFCEKLEQLVFPYDFSKVNGRGTCFFSPILYTIFRVFMLLLQTANFGYCAYFFQSSDLLYFTNWGLMLSTLCSLILMVENLFNWCFQGQTPVKYWKVSHFFFTITLVFQTFISTVYWCVLFPYSVVNLWGELGMYDILNPVMAHAVPIFLLLIDFQFNLVVIWNSIFIPFQVGMLIIYLVVNCVYTIEVEIIYTLMSYKNWLTYVFLIVCAIAIVICHYVIRIFCKYCKQQRIIKIVDEVEDKVSLFSQVTFTKPQISTNPTLPTFGDSLQLVKK